jgi:hypothetical protein
MSVEETIEAEAVAQALCMTTADFRRAFEAFANKAKRYFRGTEAGGAPVLRLPKHGLVAILRDAAHGGSSG